MESQIYKGNAYKKALVHCQNLLKFYITLYNVTEKTFFVRIGVGYKLLTK